MKHAAFLIPASLLTLLGATMSCAKESEAAGTAGTKLTLHKPADQTMAQGESNRVAVKVERSGFAGPVDITFSNLPSGVTVDGDSIVAGESSRDFVLVASPTAAVADRQIVTVKAKASGATTSTTFELTVKAKS